MALLAIALGEPSNRLVATDRASAESFNIGSAPVNLRATGLDSTIRVEWTPVNDSRIAWQYLTAKDSSGGVVASKVIPSDASSADMNGLRTGERFTISLHMVSADNKLSRPVSVESETVLQLPMQGAIFFDNFNDVPKGHHSHHSALDPDYYDVRTFSDFGDTVAVPHTTTTMLSERHYHTQLIESQGDGGLHARARIPVPISDNTATFQFETDISAVQDGPGQLNNSHGKWWVVAFSNKIVDAHGDFTHKTNDPSFISIDFSAYGKRGADRNNTNLAKIGVISNGTRREFIGTKPLITPTNVRVPITVTLNRSTATMIVNGEKVLEATGLSLPQIPEGYWSIGHANYRSGYIDSFGGGLDQPTITNQLVHWDTIQFNSPNAAGYIPLLRTYQAPDCLGSVRLNMRAHQIMNCPYLINRWKLSSEFVVDINDDLSKARSAKVLLNGPRNSDVVVTANGTEIARFKPLESRLHELTAVNLSGTQIKALRQGQNSIRVSTPSYTDYRGVGAFQLEVVYDLPKTFSNPPQEYVPRLAAINYDQRFDSKNYPGGTARGVAYLYSSGSNEPVIYTLRMHTSNTPWLRILSPASGEIRSLASGGSVVRVEYEVDFSKFKSPYGSESDRVMGQPGIIMVEGRGATSGKPIEMNPMISVLAVDFEMNNRPANFYPLSHYRPTINSYNKSALPAASEIFRPYFLDNDHSHPHPTQRPTVLPTTQPTALVTQRPTVLPTTQPTALVTQRPTILPTTQPTALVTQRPTVLPTTQPSSTFVGHVRLLAGGHSANGIAPLVALEVFNGSWIKSQSLISINAGAGDAQLRSFDSNEFLPVQNISKIRVSFVNDFCIWQRNSSGGGQCAGGVDRNVRIKSVSVAGKNYPINSNSVYGQGVWTQTRGCHSGNSGSEWLMCNGFFEVPL